MPAQHTRNIVFSREDDTTPGTYNPVGSVTGIEGPDGSAKVIDRSNLDSTVVENMLGLPNNGNWTFSIDQDFGATQLILLEQDRVSQTVKNYRVSYPTSADFNVVEITRTFQGQVVSYPSSAPVDDKLTATVTILIRGLITDETP